MLSAQVRKAFTTALYEPDIGSEAAAVVMNDSYYHKKINLLEPLS